MKRIRRPMSREGSKLMVVEEGEVLPFDWASAIAAMMMPVVSIATLKTCTFVYRFPHKYPTSIVNTLPPLRNMMCTGTDILYPKAKLFSRLTAKNMTIFGTHRISGTFLGLRKEGGCLVEKWPGNVKRATMKNWVKVMRRPLSGSSFIIDSKA